MCVATLSHDLSYDVCVCMRDPCTWSVHVHPLCQSYYGCSNGTLTKQGSSGHPSRGREREREGAREREREGGRGREGAREGGRVRERERERGREGENE